MDVAVAVTDLVVDRGRCRILHGLTFAVPAGRVTGLLGPSGCGKTHPDPRRRRRAGGRSGTVTVLGVPAGAPALRARIGYVTQAPSVYADLTVRENVRYFAALSGVGARTADTAIADVGLADRAGAAGRRPLRRPARPGLAGLRAGRPPELLVLDEPTVGLDPVLRASCGSTFHALADAGTTLLVSSHVMDEAAAATAAAAARRPTARPVHPRRVARGHRPTIWRRRSCA